jgi:hypothetical protein
MRTLAAVAIIVAACQIVTGHAQSLTGKWFGKREPTGSPMVLTRVAHFPEASPAPGAPASAPPGWHAYNRAATLVRDAGRDIVRVDARVGDGVIWLDGVEVRNGIIELELRGANRPGQSFVGVAFRGADNRTYEAVYFRPFNFQAAEPGRERAVQYASHPDYPWARLRSEHPGRYEDAVSPAPDPDGWFRARLVVQGSTVRVFVNDAKMPTLAVTTLAEPRRGRVGLWVGNGSGGDFANLRVMGRD